MAANVGYHQVKNNRLGIKLILSTSTAVYCANKSVKVAAKIKKVAPLWISHSL